MKNSSVITGHLLFWALLFSVVLQIFNSIIGMVRPAYGVVPEEVVLPVAFFTLLGAAIPFYIFYWIFAISVQRKQKNGLYAFSLAIALALPLLYLAIDEEAITLQNYFRSAIFIWLFCFFGALFRSFFQWIKESKAREAMEKQKRQTELALLRSQINPHFLFNTMHNIDALIYKDPNTASNLLMKLSDMMRYMLDHFSKEKVELHQELAYIENYILIQKPRFNNDVVNYEIRGDGNGTFIASMILMPFIENAFKHYSPVTNEEKIIIEIENQKGKLNLHCKNPFQKGEKHTKGTSGIGLHNTIRRLELLYPGKHSLTINRNKGIFEVNLTLATDEN